MAKSAVCERENRPVLKGWSDEDKCIYLYQPPCKMWNCRPCSVRNRQQWSIRIAQGVGFYRMLDVNGWVFVTITSSRKLKNRDQCLHVWPKAWAKLSARMRRSYKGVKYVLLPELHKDGRVHIHAIMSNGVSTRWLKNNAHECGLGYKSESSPLGDEFMAIYYTTKYLSKSADVQQWPKHLRRIRTSQKWPLLDDDCEFSRENIQWQYYLSYDTDGLGYLALMLEEELKTPVKIL